MKTIRSINHALVTIALATAMHLDWHAARPAVHHLSLGWRWHWLMAVPVFALTALYVRRASPGSAVTASAAIIGSASILAAVVEPAWEYWADGASLEWTFGRLRLMAFIAFLGMGVVTQMTVLALARWRHANVTRMR